MEVDGSVALAADREFGHIGDNAMSVDDHMAEEKLGQSVHVQAAVGSAGDTNSQMVHCAAARNVLYARIQGVFCWG